MAVDYTNGQVGIPANGLNKVYIIENVLDFSKKPADASAVVEALNVNAKTQVLNVWCEVITPEGGTSTATVGDGGDADGFDADVNLNAAEGTVTYGVGGTDANVTAGGKFYADADTIDLTLDANAVDAAVVKVSALCVDLS